MSSQEDIDKLMAEREYLMLNLHSKIAVRDWKAVQDSVMDIRIINAKLIVYELLRRIEGEK